MSDSDEPQVINSDSDESLADSYDDSLDDDDDEDDLDDDEDDDDDYDDKDLMKSVLNNTKPQNLPTNNGNIAKTFLQPNAKPQPKFKYQHKKIQNNRSYHIYKKRSIKCLNNKFKRDKYKKYLKDIFNKSKEEQSYRRSEILRRSVSSEIVCIDDDKVETSKPEVQPKFVIGNVVGGVIIPEKFERINGAANGNESPKIEKDVTIEASVSQLLPKQNGIAELPMQMDSASFAQQAESLPTSASQENTQLSNGLDQVTATKPSPLTHSIGKVELPNATENTAEPVKMDATPAHSPQPTETQPSPPLNLYKEINQLFPKYNKILTEHVETSNEDPLMKSINENVLKLENDIVTINEIIRQKEVEWNRLLHLKRIKEEIIQRLQRKKHNLEISSRHLGENSRTLSELKELEDYLAQTNSPYAIKTALNGNNSTLHSNASSVMQLINNRASMRKDELLHEHSIINRLQKFLEKNKILAKVPQGGTPSKSVNKVLPAMSIKESSNYDECLEDSPRKLPANPNVYPNRKTQLLAAAAPESPYKPVTYNDIKLKYKVEQCAKRSAALANYKRQQMDQDESEMMARNTPFTLPLLKRQSTLIDYEAGTSDDRPCEVLPQKASNFKRKHYEIEDDDEDDYIETTAKQNYTETVYQFDYPQNYLPKSNSNDFPYPRRLSSANQLLINAQTPRYTAKEPLKFVKHSTPILHAPPTEHVRQVDKETYSIMETTNGDTTIVNGQDHELQQQQQRVRSKHLHNGIYTAAPETADFYWDEEADADYDYRYRNPAQKPQQKIILNGKQFAQKRAADVVPRDMLSCHECNAGEARIACSGCLNQWYCSRECQIAAWANHSQTCRK